MYVDTTIEQFDSSVTSQPYEAKINVTRHTFKLLSSTIYEDKIGSIIREIISNANDAQVESKTENNMKILLPCQLSPFFSVRDYGPGLSEEDVYHLYNTYFMSSKQNTNDQIGCFGLGSKSPYSYVNEFFVTSFQQGVKKVYIAQLQQGIPTIQKLSESETDEEDGLQVKFSVDSNDFQEFKKKFDDFFSLTGLTVDLNGSIKESDFKGSYDVYMESEKFRVFTSKTTQWSRFIKLKMGIVTYTIPESYLESVNTTRHHYACNFIIEVPIGAVAPTVSRESLSKEEKTDKALGEIMRTITTNVIQTFKQELKEFKKRDDVFKSLYLFYKYDILRKYVLPNQLNLTSYFPFYKDFNKIKHKAYHVRSNGIPEKISKNDIFTLLEGNRLTVDDIITVTHDIMERTPSLTKLRGKVILFIEDSSTQYPDVEDFKKYVATIPKQSVQKVKRHSVKVSMYEGKYVVTKKEQERFRTLLNKIEPCNHVIATVQDINYLKKINTDCFYIDDFIKTNAKKAKKLYIECFIHDYIFYNNFLKTFLKIRTEKIQEIAEYNRLMDQFPTVIRYLRQVIQINDTNYVCYLNENDLKPFGIDVIKIQSAIQKRIDKFLSDYPFIKYLEAKTPYYMVSDYVSFQKSKQGVENGNHSR